MDGCVYTGMDDYEWGGGGGERERESRNNNWKETPPHPYPRNALATDCNREQLKEKKRRENNLQTMYPETKVLRTYQTVQPGFPFIV